MPRWGVEVEERWNPAAARLPRRAALLLFSGYAWSLLLVDTIGFFALAYLLAPVVGRQRAFRGTLRAWARFNMIAGFFRREVEGRERLRLPAVIAVNHQHVMDVIFLASVVPPPFVFMARAELLRVPIVGPMLRHGDHVIVRRGGGTDNQAALAHAAALLRAGVNIVVFPEGTRFHSGRVGAFKGGAFRIAALASAPLVAGAMVGTSFSAPSGTPYVVPTRLKLRFLPEIAVSEAESTSRELRERVRKLVEVEVLALEREMATLH